MTPIRLCPYRLLFLPALIAAALPAWANDDDAANVDATSSPWSGSGEFGYASARGNSSTDTLNGKLALEYTDGDWIHNFNLFGLRSSAEYTDDDANGNPQTRSHTTANRFTVGAGSALQLGEHRQLTSALRHERDEFATYDWQQSVSVGYGTRMLDGSRLKLDAQVGPGFRRAHNTQTQEVETGAIGRGFLNLKYALTENTELGNTLLIESGRYNTFAQNDLGLSVAMNSHLALKAGWQTRHNTEVSEDRKKTDTLTTMNVVYRFR